MHLSTRHPGCKGGGRGRSQTRLDRASAHDPQPIEELQVVQRSVAGHPRGAPPGCCMLRLLPFEALRRRLGCCRSS